MEVPFALSQAVHAVADLAQQQQRLSPVGMPHGGVTAHDARDLRHGWAEVLARGRPLFVPPHNTAPSLWRYARSTDLEL